MRSAVAALILGLALICGAVPAGGSPQPNLLLARLSDLHGFGPAEVSHFSTMSATEWAEGQNRTTVEADSESQQLVQYGFQLGLAAFFLGRREAHGRHREAVSDTLVFATATDAREDLAVQIAESVRSYEKHGLEQGTMRSIPGSVTLGDFMSGKRGGTGNVFFTTGRCLFVVGDAIHDAPTRTVAAGPAMAAARAVFSRARPSCE